MIPFEINISDFVASSLITPNQVKSYSRYLLDKVADNYMRIWESTINSSLHQTKNAYKRGINVEYIDDYNIAFVLEGKGESIVALMLETGTPPFDEKNGFRNSSKRKQSKDGGWYLTIPFRMATSEAVAESTIFSGVLEPKEQELIKDVGTVRSKDLPSEFQQKGVRKEINRGGVNIPEYKHKSPKLEGAKRMVSTKENRGQYMKFRRVSDKSDDYSWIHPGFEEYNLMGKALDRLSSELPGLLEQAQKEFFS